MKLSTLLRKHLATPNKVVIAPGAYDGLSARLIAEAGFEAIYMTGGGSSAARLGQPDLGLMTMTEMVNRARDEVENTIRTEGEQAANKSGVHGLPPELIRTLGRLKYRFSYGQNVLMHSVEVSLLAGMMASEIGANVEQAKRAGLLHDLGKAVDFETEGPHAQIGADLIKQWEKSPDVVRAVAAHHGEVEMNTALAFLVAASDAISASRPGARRESLEQYLKHLEAL